MFDTVCVFQRFYIYTFFNYQGKSYDDVAVTLHGDEIDGLMKILLMEIDFWFYGNQEYTQSDEEEIDAKRKSSSYGSPRWVRGRSNTHQKEFCKACSLKVCNKIVVGEWDKQDQSALPVFRNRNGEERSDLLPVFTEPSQNEIIKMRDAISSLNKEKHP